MKNDILILHKVPTQGLDDTKFTIDAQCSINFIKKGMKHWNEVYITSKATVIYLLME